MYGPANAISNGYTLSQATDAETESDASSPFYEDLDKNATSVRELAPMELNLEQEGEELAALSISDWQGNGYNAWLPASRTSAEPQLPSTQLLHLAASPKFPLTPSLGSAGGQNNHCRKENSAGKSRTQNVQCSKPGSPEVPCRAGQKTTPLKPEQRESRLEMHRERIKRLFSGAKSGLIGWSKGLTGKR